MVTSHVALKPTARSHPPSKSSGGWAGHAATEKGGWVPGMGREPTEDTSVLQRDVGHDGVHRGLCDAKPLCSPV